MAKTTLLTAAVAVVVARHARATNYAREDQGLKSQKLRMRVGNAYPVHRKRTYQVRRGCSRLPACAAHVHTARTATGWVLELQLVTAHVSPYPLGFGPCFYVSFAHGSSYVRWSPKYHAHGTLFVVPFLVLSVPEPAVRSAQRH